MELLERRRKLKDDPNAAQLAQIPSMQAVKKAMQEGSTSVLADGTVRSNTI
ncbi:hypothetical protein KIN20_006202 [Parelaphostrongylus tenuis]|uniref:Uncharacterized protein n=1 Tax=Parelaphostrongylus tenuis TaxID=148309 RepID=A0AAD5M1D8_PARTN|nr:hypothetical protein KIN20_006202 [Parelaphostrongylus tenuis]